MPTTCVDTVIAGLRPEPNRPRFTGYTDAGRTELSGAGLLNAASKVAGLLIDELGAGPGDVVLVTTPETWQTAAIVLGCWWAGLTLTDDPDAPALAAFVPPGADAAAADDVFVVSGHPLGLPTRELRSHQRDYTTATQPQADRFVPRWDAPPGAALRHEGRELPVAAIRDAIGGWAAVGAGQRLLTAGRWSPGNAGAGVVSLLLGPLGAGAAVIHSTDLDPSGSASQWLHRAEVERADATAGVNIAGLPRID